MNLAMKLVAVLREFAAVFSNPEHVAQYYHLSWYQSTRSYVPEPANSGENPIDGQPDDLSNAQLIDAAKQVEVDHLNSHHDQAFPPLHQSWPSHLKNNQPENSQSENHSPGKFELVNNQSEIRPVDNGLSDNNNSNSAVRESPSEDRSSQVVTAQLKNYPLLWIHCYSLSHKNNNPT